jgi:hypothetical protein
MKWTIQSTVKPVLVAITLALALLAAHGPPAASADASDLAIESNCGPNVFRPNEWVVNQCLIRVTNTGDAPLTNISTDYGTASGVIPDHYFVLYEIDGQPLPIEPTGLGFGSGGALEPGQSVDVRLLTLLKMPGEGAYEGEWPTTVDGEIVPGSESLHYEAHADAAEPPTDLEVVQTLLGRPGDERVTFETTITSKSSSDVTDLSLTEHYGDGVTLAAVEPAGAELTGVNLLKFDLISFGKESLAPGEALTLRTTYESADALRCPYAESGLVVEATVGGETQLYGARAGGARVCGPERAVEPPPDGGDFGDGRGGPLEPPSTGAREVVRVPSAGEGQSSTSVPMAACAALAASGVALVGASQLVRWRRRQ